MRLLLTSLLVGALALGPNVARAQAEMEWSDTWEPFRPWEYGATGALLTWAFVAKFALGEPGPDTADLPGELAVTKAFLVDSSASHRTLLAVTDASLILGLSLPFIDAFLAGALHGDWKATLQMSAISLESISTFLAILWSAQAALGRVRPTARICELEGDAAPSFACVNEASEVNRSIIAGHTAGAWVGAGLTCLHHVQLPIYGGGWPDYLACGVMVTSALLNGFGRLAVGAHYVSDVLLGTAVGTFAGFVLPAILHYGFGPYRPLTFENDDELSGVRITVVPHGLGFGLTGVF